MGHFGEVSYHINYDTMGLRGIITWLPLWLVVMALSTEGLAIVPSEMET